MTIVEYVIGTDGKRRPHVHYLLKDTPPDAIDYLILHDEIGLGPTRLWVCTGCGCTDLRACPGYGGCRWVTSNLCSRCAS